MITGACQEERHHANRHIRFRAAVEQVKALLREGEVLAVGYSGGKDSSAVLNICLIALRELKDEDFVPERLYVTSANTLIENPAIDVYLRQHWVRQLRGGNGPQAVEGKSSRAAPRIPVTLSTLWALTRVAEREAPSKAPSIAWVGAQGEVHDRKMGSPSVPSLI